MIPAEFGELSFRDLVSRDIEVRFNALEGSNTRPSGTFNVPVDAEANLKKLSD